MRVREISVTKLFGMFDHTIPLNQVERITIIHGPNGFGKTAMLRLLDGVFGPYRSTLRSIPFEKFSVSFDDNTLLEVEKLLEPQNSTSKTRRGRQRPITIKLLRPNTTSEHFQLGNIEQWEREPERYYRLEQFLPEIERIGPDKWLSLDTSEQLTLFDIQERYGEYLPNGLFPEDTKEPKWFSKLQGAINSRLIQTQRLLLVSKNQTRRHRVEAPTVMQSVVVEYAKELSSNIKTKLGEYATLTQSLDRTFPVRLFKQATTTNLTDAALHEQLNELEIKRQSLTKLGLLDIGEEPTLPISEMTEQNKNALTVYVEDMDKKLSVFDEIAEKIKFFKEIVNERFLYKRMEITKDKGITFFTDDAFELPPDSLSSGEQHELVLFYDLLFKVRPNSLILIDEPEISLHIEWQLPFLRDIQKVAQLSNFDVVIATHSPQIIAGRWDLTVELKGPQKPLATAQNGRKPGVKRKTAAALTP